MIKLYDKVAVLGCNYCKHCPVSEKVGTVIHILEEVCFVSFPVDNRQLLCGIEEKNLIKL